MKFRITMKTPNALSQILDADPNLDEEYVNQIQQLELRFLEYGELLTVEFDTDEQSATVIPL